MTYIAVLGADIVSVLGNLGGFLAEYEQKQKYGCLVFSYFQMTMAASLKDLRRQPLVFHRGGIHSIKNLGEGNMPRFFNIDEF